MAKNYLDEDGTLYLWQKIKSLFALKTDVPAATTTTPKMDGTAAIGSDTKWAKGDHVHPTDTSRAPLASPTFTGTPKAPTATAGTNNTQIATTAFVATAVSGLDIPEASTTTPSMDGTASAGSESDFARGDHVHPTDTSRAPLASPTFTGTPKAPTANAGTNTTQIATTAFVQAAISSLPSQDTNTTYVLSQDATDGHKITLTGSDGTTKTVTIPDNDTKYSAATTSANGLMSKEDKTKLNGFSSASDYALKSDITNMYRFKGSVATSSLLPSTGQTAGDVYNIEAESTYGPAGTNVAWDGTGWDALGGIFSISSITNAWIDANCV